MTHIDNVEHICKHGITHVNSPVANKDYVTIGDSSIINTRNDKVLKNGKKLSDYIPFYFGLRMPMLYVIQNGYNGVKQVSPENIIYCVTNIYQVLNCNVNFAYTDGHALNGFSQIYFEDSINNIDRIVDFEAVNSRNWNSDFDLDLKRRKEAEFLVGADLPPNLALWWVVFNEMAKERLQELGVDNLKILIKPKLYF